MGPKVCILLLTALLVKTGFGSKCLTSWITSESISHQAVYIGELTEIDSKDQWLFPQLNITCSTTITRLRFIGDFINKGNKVPELQFWRRSTSASSQYSKLHHTDESATVTFDGLNRFVTSVSWQVEPGDVFGVYQTDIKKSRFDVTMQERGGGKSYVLKNQKRAPDRFDTLRHSDAEHPYPLFNVEAVDMRCISGFLDDQEIVKKANVKAGAVLNNLSSNENQVRIIPSVRFGCNGTITKVVFAAEAVQTTNSPISHPELQLWYTRLHYNYFWFYNRRGRASLEEALSTSAMNVYEKTLRPPLRFEAGDILGLYLPEEGYSPLKVFFQSTFLAHPVPSYSIQQNNMYTFFNANHSSINIDYDAPLLNIEFVADCGQPASPAHGTVSVASTTAGSLASYQCDDGYKLVGDSQRSCSESDGEWTPAVPICQIVECGQPASPMHGTVNVVSTTARSLARYECDNGYKLVGSSQQICTDGEWTSTVPTCQIVDCGQPATPDHGRVTVTSTTAGSVAKYNCENGYRLVGENQRTCVASTGRWSSTIPSCQIVDCQTPTRPTNGQVSYINQSDTTSFGSVVTYSCDEGFEMRGTATRQCTASGEWSGSTPTCSGIECGIPEVPLNGYAGLTTMIPGSELNTRAEYGCSEGYTLIGVGVRICGPDKMWNGSAPHCGILQEAIQTTTADHELTTYESLSTEATSPKSTPDVSTTLPVETLSGVTDAVDLPSYLPHSLSSKDIAIVLVITILSVIVVSMIAAILAVYRQKKKRKRKQVSCRNMMAAVADLQDNSIDNPVYGGDHRFSFNVWEHLITPSLDNDPTLYSNPAYDGCDGPAGTASREKHAHTPGKRPSLYYDVASIINPLAYEHYEMIDNENHYEMASDFDIPALPYEIPTLSSQRPSTKLYESLPWGTYVPTEEERSASYSNVPPSSSAPVLHKSHVLVGSKQVFFEESVSYWKPASDSASLYEQLSKNKYREISRQQIRITENLGSGQFGQVARGLWQSPIGVIPVAIKTLKESRKGGNEDQVRFLQEAAINGQFQHRNVVKLYGVVTLGRPVMIVLELCTNGDLREYLLQSRPSPGGILASCWPLRLLNFCKDVACGMEYLSRKSFVHRDLAARNILVATDKTCKISDFGLSRDLENESYYISHGGKIPVKWTAPEALHYKRYSTASDVWSFGCVMYEIWSLGHKPFEQYANMEIIRMIDKGFRLAPPPGCIRSIYHLMIKCWHPKSSARPTFSDLLQSLKGIEPLAGDVTHLTAKERPNTNLKLGDPLDHGLNLFTELQNLYIDNAYY